MKKLILILLVCLTLCALCACKSTDGGNAPDAPQSSDTPQTPKSPETASELRTVLNQTEYILYMNVFQNDQGQDFLGKTITKEGTFATVQDAFSQKLRYYVWGYNDATKCCDWQWEFVPAEGQELPSNGSFVKMTGTFGQSDEALDGYWFTDATLELETSYKGPDCDVDMTCMSGTLERVQLFNMQYKSEYFEGKTACAYGRIKKPGTFQDPYYDGSWSQDFIAGNSELNVGTMAVISGTFRGGVFEDCTVEESDVY